MTKKQRAQVVELLRCAADCGARGAYDGLYTIARDLGHPTWEDVAHYTQAVVWHQACEARHAVYVDGVWYGNWCALLEAAARVERGWTP